MLPLSFAFEASDHRCSSVLPTISTNFYFQFIVSLVKSVPLLPDKGQLLIQYFVLPMKTQELLKVGLGELLFGHFFQLFLFRKVLYVGARGVLRSYRIGMFLCFFCFVLGSYSFLTRRG